MCKKLLYLLFSSKWVICYSYYPKFAVWWLSVISHAKATLYIEYFLTGDKESTNLKESKNKSRTDLSAMIAEQLMMPLHDFGPQKVVSTEPVDVKSSETTGVETNQDKEVISHSKTCLIFVYFWRSCNHHKWVLHYVLALLQLIFTQKSTASLQSLNAGDILVEMCLNLPHLLRYRNKYTAAISKKGFSLPSTHTEALLVRHRSLSLLFKF